MVYSDYLEKEQGNLVEHPVNDYQLGSIRDEFDFGYLMLFSIPAIRRALGKYGPIPAVVHAGLYDLRLKVSVDHSVFHIQEFLYTMQEPDDNTEKVRSQHEDQFNYVSPRNQAVQKEMELVATEHLRNIGAFLEPRFKHVPQSEYNYPVEASVIIPVLNRVRTITDAVRSALTQETDFPYNVIVVDNHSTDGTSPILSALAGRSPAVKHIIPSRYDLTIGGCWNEAVFSDVCGRYAVQLDSDDLYEGPGTLQKLIDVMRSGDFAMVIGSYTLVNESLQTIPPGIIDHREWTDDNGRNNALRVNGLGAPRAFYTALLRKIGFLNVGYGEDYAMALRLSRDYRIGRIYESLYLCRRWAGNTDARISIEMRNRHDAFKDKIRTVEIMARRKLKAR
jgi:GT2 family glycosyltransferase